MDTKQRCWVVLLILVTLGLFVACRQPDGRIHQQTSPTATGTRVVAPTRDEVPAQTVAPLRARPVIPPTLTPSPVITGTITATVTTTTTPEQTLSTPSGSIPP